MRLGGVWMGYFLQQIVNGVHVGALYALLAFGYAIAHAILKRASFVQGALFAFAGQLTILFTGVGWQVLWLVYPAALAFGALMAMVYSALAAGFLARTVLSPLRLATPNTTIAASLGVLLVLMEGVRLASGSHMPWLSPFLNNVLALDLGGGFSVTTTPVKLGLTFVAFGVVVSIGQFLRRSTAGRLWRAASQDDTAARLLGVNTEAVFLGTMLASGMVCGLSGILAAFHYGNIDFGTGLAFAVKILFVASLGGLDEPHRAAMGGLAIGVFEALWDGFFPSIWRDVATFSLLCALLVILNRENRLSA